MYLDAQKPKSSHTNVCSKWVNTNRHSLLESFNLVQMYKVKKYSDMFM